MAAVMANGVKESARPVVEDYLKLVDVRKEFDGFVAVDDTNLSIRKGEIFALLEIGRASCRERV